MIANHQTPSLPSRLSISQKVKGLYIRSYPSKSFYCHQFYWQGCLPFPDSFLEAQRRELMQGRGSSRYIL